MGKASIKNLADVRRCFWPLVDAVENVLRTPEIIQTISMDHVSLTPLRVAAAFQQYFGGCFEDPEKVLSTGFEEKLYDQMVIESRVGFFSTCAHHLAPFFGKAHFGYIPEGKVVGLSKIPRLIEIYARRPQVQEKLTQEIVNTFDRIIQPKGCGVVIEAYHLCVASRGVECEGAVTTTTALKGCFRDDACKMEFLSRIPKGENIWP